MRDVAAVLSIMIPLVACSGAPDRGGTSYQVAGKKTISAVTVRFDKPIVGAGEQLHVHAIVTYTMGGEADMAETASWSSSDLAVATVSQGLITAVAPGHTTISVTVSDKSASAELTVSPAGATLLRVIIDPSSNALDVGQTLALAAHAEYDSGNRFDVSALASWSSSSPAFVSLNGSTATGVAPGAANITVSFDGLSDQRTLTVRAPIMVSAVEVSPPSASLGPGTAQQLTATAIKTDGTREPVTNVATWRSSNPAVATVDASGRAVGVGAGQAQIFAAYGGHEASANLSVVVCQYPTAGTHVADNTTIPNMSWTGVFQGTGGTTNFSTESFFCDPAFAQYSSVHFIIGAGWCPNCPSYIQGVNADAAAIQAAGGLIVYVEIEDDNYNPATHSNANATIGGLIGSGPGLRLGDGQTMPTAMVFGQAVSSVPNAFVVRKSDMKVIASQGSSQYVLDFVQLAQQAAGGGGGGGGGSACPANTEESYEPNDQASQAGSLAAGAIVDGGVCDANPDFYRVTYSGAWRLDLTFTHAVGDLDVYVYDSSTMMPMVDASGHRVGSEGTVNNESFTYNGPATVMVVGYNGANAPYRLTVTGM